jgi:hypothetical protein
MRRLTIVGMAALVLLLSPGAAAGGGWWSWVDLEERTTAPGLEAETTTEVWFETMEQANRAIAGEDIYHAFLLPSFDAKLERKIYRHPYRRGWWEPQPGAIDLGRLTVEPESGNLANASIAFTMPEVEPGAYFLMFCTPGCEREMGDMIPTPIEVVASPAHAAAANRVDAVEARLYQQRSRMNRALRRVRKQRDDALEQVGSFHEELAETNEQIDALAARTRATASPEPDRGLPDSSLLALGALAGALGTFAAMRSRAARARPGAPSPEPFASLGPLGGSAARSRPARTSRSRRPLARTRSRG